MKYNNPKKKKLWIIPVTLTAALLVFAVLGAAIGLSRRGNSNTYINCSEVRIVEDLDHSMGIGDVEIRTLSIPKGISVKRAHYSATGKVLLAYQTEMDGKKTNGLAIMNDDGTGWHSLYVGSLGGSKLLPYADNTRVLTGDTVIECPAGYTWDTCPENAAQVYDIVYPSEYTGDKNVSKLWSEVIIAPDNIHMAWTMLRTDCGAAVAIGELVKDGAAYRLENPQLCSRMNIYHEDPDHEGYLLADSVIGGEVKQFVHGGAAISLVGADTNGDAQSVILDIATGEYAMVTKTLGYDETTIFSPSEKYGMTMTTRFSDTTRLDFLGLLPRPYGDAICNITSTIYMYGVTGARNEREGSIGPALVNIERSMTDSGYMGLNLSDPESEWVFCSPMSWNTDSTKAMWMEERRDGTGTRVQLVTLLEAEPSEAVPTVTTPSVGDYADKDSNVPDVDGKIAGKVSGYVQLTTENGLLNSKSTTVTYCDYSDDGVYFYNGTEFSKGSVISNTTYTADLTVTDKSGNVVGSMDVELHWGAAYKLTSAFTGSTSPKLYVDKSHANVTWQGIDMTGEHLIP